MMGPTGGYLLGFVAGAWLCGWLAERGFDRSPLRTLIAMSLGHALIFVFGVTWLAQLIGFEKAFATGVVPFWAATIAKTLLVSSPFHWRGSGSADSNKSTQCKRTPVRFFFVAMKFLRLTDLDLNNKRVFIRADLNVPQDDAGKITDDTRIRASVPGIQFALKAGAAVMVTSHISAVRPRAS